MQITFYKYQGTGNDFVIIDNREQVFPKNDSVLINKMCDRKFGVGADGFILLEKDETLDFKMCYYNADGNESTMCGNGGRCIVAFANFLGIIANETRFMAIDGYHSATINDGIVSLQMMDVAKISSFDSYSFLDTGSPHHVQLVTDLQKMNIKKEGAKLRYGKYGEVGSNINFVHQINETLFDVRTYERGVEDETLSCGTGVTAVALAMHNTDVVKEKEIELKTLGGALKVSFEKAEVGYENIFLTGPATQVFKGYWG